MLCDEMDEMNDECYEEAVDDNDQFHSVQETNVLIWWV